MKSIQELRNSLERLKGKKEELENSISKVSTELSLEKRSLRQYEQAKAIITEVGIKTQQQLQFHISDITSLALDAIFTDPYSLKLEFVKRRDKVECDILFTRDEMEVDPLSASGGGAVDVASFALRIASWSLQRPHTRNVIIMDEPLRFLSVDNQERASVMIKEISKKLGIQFIIVTHEQALTPYADKVFEVSINKGVSKIKQWSNQ